MSLLCAYSDSSSDEDDEGVGVGAPLATSSAPRLPSADELFASDTSVLSAARRRPADAISGLAQPPAKKPKATPTPTTAAPTSSSTKMAPALFAPPQLRRPNVSTEDLGAWNTQKTMALQRRSKHEPQSAAS